MNTPPASTVRSDPFSPNFQRLAAAAGIGFAVLLVLSIAFGGGDTPDFNDPVSEWSTYAKDNESNLRIGALLFGLATYEFVLFLGYLRSELGAAETAARGFARVVFFVLVGGVVGIVGLALGVFLNAAAVSHPDDTSPELIRGLAQLAGAGFGVAAAGFSAMLISAALLVLRARALPAWLGWLGLFTGVCFLLQYGVLLSEEYDNAFGIFYPLAFLGLVVWSIACSVIFVRRIGTTDAGVARAGTGGPPGEDRLT